MAMEKLIPVVMKLQDAFNVINVRNQIEMPQIVVVGSQSTGKSSVLESIVGRDFLPRGSGIVTRCPLVLQLKRIDAMQEWGEFLHKKGERFSDFAKIRREIEEQTMRIAGVDKNISDEPISLTIFSPNVVDLTMVDLPGITKVPIRGQPHDIEDQIKRITYKFISQQNALILALTAANTDLANSDALKMAREVDPAGERTIGVVTKIDLMDQGTDALDLLQGKIYPLQLGYYGVKCRSQKQIDENLTIRQALDSERQFFSTHPTYSSYIDRLGIPYLAESLNRILCGHIVKCIPTLSRQINELL
jgi:replication fork clamp-binding protein CrfC